MGSHNWSSAEESIDPIERARLWLKMPDATSAQVREELVAQVVAGLRSRICEPPALGYLQDNFQGEPETLFCQGLAAWSLDRKAHGYVYFQKLDKTHPLSPYSALLKRMLPEWHEELKNEGELSELIAFEKLLAKISRSESGWGQLVAPAAARASAANRRKLAWACYENGSIELALSIAQSGRDAKHLGLLHAAGFFSLLLGRLGQAQEIGLIALELANSDNAYLAMELLASIGDDDSVIKLYARGAREPGCLHLAAVAYAREGDWSIAENLWSQALAQDSSLQIAAANLENARKNPRDRSSAWPFNLHHWSRRGNLTPALVHILLDRGDPVSLEQALIEAVRDADAHAGALRDFAAGARGTQALRSLCARMLEVPAPLFSPTTEGILGALSVTMQPALKAKSHGVKV